MSDGSGESNRRIEPIDIRSLEARLRRVARTLAPDRGIDDLEVRHLARVITGCALLHDVYSDDRIARIMATDRRILDGLINRWLNRLDVGQGNQHHLARRLPDDVRRLGDKALFDRGMLGRRQVKGYDLEELGVRAYRTAGEALELLADDRRLKEFFKDNQLLMLPLEEEVTFLRQCSERFRFYADVLRGAQRPENADLDEAALEDLMTRVPLMAAAAEAIAADSAATTIEESQDDYVEAAQGQAEPESVLSREQLISRYERILRFSGLDLPRLEQALNETVIDQPQAVERLCDEFSLFAAGTRDLRKPPAYFLVGPTGVGKNHLVESLCRLLEGIWQIDVPMLTIEGPNYTYPSDINELRGATRGFIRSDEEGLLTTFHERAASAPFSVILIDEVEKAHPQLLTFFLSILDRGTTTDNRGSVLNFSNCMIFFTSNLGYSDAQQKGAPIGYGDDETREQLTEQEIRRELRRGLKPEFVNRVRLLHFNRLSRQSAERILDLELAKISRRYSELHDLTLELDDSARDALIERGFSPVFGARHLSAVLETVCNVELAKRVRRDDDADEGERERMVTWLREMREGERAFDGAEVKRRVTELARARLDYRCLRIGFRDDEFVYEAQEPE